MSSSLVSMGIEEEFFVKFADHFILEKPPNKKGIKNIKCELLTDIAKEFGWKTIKEETGNISMINKLGVIHFESSHYIELASLPFKDVKSVVNCTEALENDVRRLLNTLSEKGGNYMVDSFSTHYNFGIPKTINPYFIRDVLFDVFSPLIYLTFERQKSKGIMIRIKDKPGRIEICGDSIPHTQVQQQAISTFSMLIAYLSDIKHDSIDETFLRCDYSFSHCAKHINYKGLALVKSDMKDQDNLILYNNAKMEDIDLITAAKEVNSLLIKKGLSTLNLEEAVDDFYSNEIITLTSEPLRNLPKINQSIVSPDIITPDEKSGLIWEDCY